MIKAVLFLSRDDWYIVIAIPGPRFEPKTPLHV